MTLRLATPADVPELQVLIAESVQTLQAAHYSQAQRDGALGVVFGIDNQLIRDGTYFVAEVGGIIAGCGGWSFRQTLFGSDAVHGKSNNLLDPSVDGAKIRAFFVHAGFARRGIASAILATCESAATAAGFKWAELGSTLTGEALYAARGYTPTDRIQVPLGNGEMLPIIRMRKNLIVADGFIPA